MSRRVARAPKRFQQVTLTTGTSTRHGRDMESNKKSTGAKTRSREQPIEVSRARLDEIVEEIVNVWLSPYRCKGSRVEGKFKSARELVEADVRRTIERGPRNHLSVDPRAVRKYAKRLSTWVAEGRALLPRLKSSGSLDVEHIPAGIRFKAVYGALDYMEDYQDHHLRPDEFAEQLPNAFGAFSKFYGGLEMAFELLATVGAEGQRYQGPVGSEDEQLPVRSPNYDKVKESCARDALGLILNIQKDE
jgi:hypothetical protein